MRGYGRYGKQIRLFEQYHSFANDPEVQALIESGEMDDLMEGIGGVEGRADFPLYLATITHHKMREGFTRRASRWNEYMAVESVEDFREHTMSQLNGLQGMGAWPEYDEPAAIRSSEEMAPSIIVGKHGGWYGLTYEMIVNDDTNLILNRTPTEIGRLAAAYMARAFAALVESNPNWIDGNPFFWSGARPGLPNGNVVTGSGAEPSEDNLLTLCQSILDTTDNEGFPIDIEAGNVLTRDLRTKVIFDRILRSTETGTTSPSTSTTTMDKGTYNPTQDLLSGTDPVIVERYLTDPNDWTLLANNGRPAFRAAFLNGVQEPTILRTAPPAVTASGGAPDPYDFFYDDLKFKVRAVFGTALGDPRSARKAVRS